MYVASISRRGPCLVIKPNVGSFGPWKFPFPYTIDREAGGGGRENILPSGIERVPGPVSVSSESSREGCQGLAEMSAWRGVKVIA